MNPRVKHVTALSDYKLHIEFTNGERGTYDCSHLLDFGVFRELKDKPYFKKAMACDGTVVWPNEQDICPDTLYIESIKGASKNASVHMFQGTITLFDEYYRHLDAAEAPGFNRDLGCEVRERIHQINYIVERIYELERTAKEAFSHHQAAFIKHIENLKRRGVSYESVPTPPSVNITKDEFDRHEKALFEMKLLTETYYYLAGRVRTILKNVQAPLPGLTSFECEGTRNVRNKLLEHAESKDSQISIQSFGWGADHGPVLKAIRCSGQEHIFPDRGLYTNAEEFRVNLERLLQAELSKA